MVHGQKNITFEMVIRYVDVIHCKKMFGKWTGLSFFAKLT